jgi:riboflavin kinase/FMN adenylyltransferase
MQVYDSIEALGDIEKGCALSIGNFDGVHLGHQKIIAAVRAACERSDASGVALLTFDPHPVAILHPERAPGVLTPLVMKKQLIAECGVDSLIVLKDSYELLNLSPKGFVDEFLMKKLRPSIIVEGENFNFGYGRSGDVWKLRELGQERGFEVMVVDAKEVSLSSDAVASLDHSGACSSSLIRHLLEKGFVADAAVAMGRPYRLVGRTVPGRGVGTQIGFPTANIHPEDQIVPDEGVYAGLVEVGDSLEEVCTSKVSVNAVFSIGRAKTFISDHPLLIEAHILQGEVGDLTGKYLAMDFVQRIRNQQRFEDKHKLTEQISRDCQAAKDILKG